MEVHVNKTKRSLKAIAVLLLVGLGVVWNMDFYTIKRNSYLDLIEKKIVTNETDTIEIEINSNYSGKIIRTAFQYLVSEIR